MERDDEEEQGRLPCTYPVVLNFTISSGGAEKKLKKDIQQLEEQQLLPL